MKKKITAVLLTLCLVLGMLPLSAMAVWKVGDKEIVPGDGVIDKDGSKYYSFTFKDETDGKAYYTLADVTKDGTDDTTEYEFYEYDENNDAIGNKVDNAKLKWEDDPDPTPANCTCSTKCTENSTDENCEVCKDDYSKCEAGEAVVEQVATPVITPADGTEVTEGGKVTVSITCETEGASIYYTTDGKAPSSESTPYSKAFELTISEDTTVKAIAVKDDMTDSAIAYATYKAVDAGTVLTPVITPADGTKVEKGTKVQVSITCETEGATIHYTTDGTNPSTASTAYSKAFELTIDEDTTVKAIAVKENMTNSTIASVTYKAVDPATVEAPVIGFALQGESVVVTITCGTDDADIYYNINGTTDPTASSTKYEGAFSRSMVEFTVKAIAIKGDVKSAVATNTYTPTKVEAETGTVTAEPTVKTEGNKKVAEASFTVTDEDAEKLVENAQEGTVTLKVETTEKANKVVAHLPNNVVRAAKASKTVTTIAIPSDVGTVNLPVDDIGEDDVLEVEAVEPSGGIKGGISLELSSKEGKESNEEQFKNPVTVEFTAQGADASSDTVAYQGRNGLVRVRTLFSTGTKFKFKTRHFSDFVVVDKDTERALIELKPGTGANDTLVYTIENDETLVTVEKRPNGNFVYKVLGVENAGELGNARISYGITNDAEVIDHVYAIVGELVTNANGVDLTKTTLIRGDMTNFGGGTLESD